MATAAALPLAGLAPAAAPASLSHPVPHVLGEGDASKAESWFAMHRAYVEAAARQRPRVLFMGDSLTYGWRVEGGAAWQAHLAPLDSLAFGIGGDLTEDVLWRIGHGELDRIAPRLFVLEIGTNDLGTGLPAAQAAEGVAACVRAARAKLPAATILVSSILPRGGGPHDPMRRAVSEANARIARLDDGKTIRYLDCTKNFVDARGDLRRSLFRWDLIHLSPDGYETWGAALARRLRPLLG